MRTDLREQRNHGRHGGQRCHLAEKQKSGTKTSLKIRGVCSPGQGPDLQVCEVSVSWSLGMKLEACLLQSSDCQPNVFHSFNGMWSHSLFL